MTMKHQGLIDLATGPLIVLLAAGAAAALSRIEKTTDEKTIEKSTSMASASGPSSSGASASADGKQKWLYSLDDGLVEARKDNRPVLVRAGATWCGWCRKLEAEIAKPAVRKALSSYVLVYLDIDDQPKESRTLGIDAVPALRILTPAGRVTASQDGYLEADELVEWLSQPHFKTAPVPANLTKDEPPDARAVEELVQQLRGREPLYREAAIQRLMPHPQTAAPAIAALFADGGLSERLAAMELLTGWKAPVQGLDPWRPDTITPAHVEALRAWAEETAKRPASAPAEIAAESIEHARRELARLLQAERDAEAEIVRERLARLGPALLPIVVEEIRQAGSDRDRERLTALRYRLAAPARLAMEWPGGLERLASMDADTRRQAAEDLAKRAGADTAPLLRELFSNPDPLVREISLRALRKVGGEEANEALTSLLDDPEPNVRAAVLKQLSEQPSRKMVAKLAEYAAREKDADLLVHTVRVLRATGGKAALDALMAMVGHDTWQVRAEVAEAIGEVLSQSGDLPQTSRADAYVALIGMLKDGDGFVVSRAVTGLQNADVSLVIKPLVQAAQEHPELAGPLIELLANRGGDHDQVVKHLRDLLKAQHASVRAAAIVSLCQMAPKQAREELLAAFGDPEEDVRFAAARGFLSVLDSYRPDEQGADSDATVLFTGGRMTVYSSAMTARTSSRRLTTKPVTSSAPVAGPQSQPAGSGDWLERFRAGSERPKWMEQVVPPLQGLLSSSQPERRLTAAVGLIALGRDETGLRVLREVTRAQPATVSQAARGLRWLPLATRLTLFEELLALASETQVMTDLINGLAALPDPRAAKPLWDLLDRKDMAAGWAPSIHSGLRRLYFFGQEYSRPNLKTSQRQQLVAELRPPAETGPELRRLVALSLLLTASKSDAVTVATKLYEDPKNSEALRTDALQIVLLGQGREQAVKTAAAALSGTLDLARGLALTYLARGRGNLALLRDNIPLLIPDLGQSPDEVTATGSPITPQPPPGLTAENVRPLLSSTDGPTRAHAGYLLALLKQADGLEPLVDYWRQHARQDPNWRRQVYRAVSALNDDRLTPILEEIYADIIQEDWELREFYWTIRSMDGEAVLALRKKIRTDVGMERLK